MYKKSEEISCFDTKSIFQGDETQLMLSHSHKTPVEVCQMAIGITILDHYNINMDFHKFPNEIMEIIFISLRYVAYLFFNLNGITNHS